MYECVCERVCVCVCVCVCVRERVRVYLCLSAPWGVLPDVTMLVVLNLKQLLFSGHVNPESLLETSAKKLMFH